MQIIHGTGTGGQRDPEMSSNGKGENRFSNEDHNAAEEYKIYLALSSFLVFFGIWILVLLLREQIKTLMRVCNESLQCM
jgi:hypothetical protein